MKVANESERLMLLLRAILLPFGLAKPCFSCHLSTATSPTISAIVSIGILELQNNDLHYELLLL